MIRNLCLICNLLCSTQVENSRRDDRKTNSRRKSITVYNKNSLTYTHIINLEKLNLYPNINLVHLEPRAQFTYTHADKSNARIE